MIVRAAACYTGQVVISALLIIHVIVCLFLIIVFLLQSGKAADLAGAFGGMGSQTAFGPRGSATLLSKATTISAIVFMLTSMSLSIVATRNAGVSSAHGAGTPSDAKRSECSGNAARTSSAEEVITTIRPGIAEVAELADALA